MNIEAIMNDDNASGERMQIDSDALASKAEIIEACKVAVANTRQHLDPERMLDAANNLVAGYAMAVLHVRGKIASPAKVLEHARAALAEAR